MAKTTATKKTRLPPSAVPADAWGVKESPGRAGASGSIEERLAS